METVSRGLLILPRSDLCSPVVDVVEWRMKAHDGQRLWGLRGQSPFHAIAQGACIRELHASELPVISLDTITKGMVDFVFQVPAGRRLEDRVLDVLRVVQVALNSGLEPNQVQLVHQSAQDETDEFMIVQRLLEQGLC
jgi:hypothetical protein